MGPQGLADICCTSELWHLGQGDLKNAFYFCGTPDWIWEYFCLLPVFGRDVADLLPPHLATSDVIYPQVKVLPMGWTWATYFCQRLLENVFVSRSGFPSSLQVLGRRPAPELGTKHSNYIIYIDNFAHLSLSKKQAQRDLETSEVALRAVGFDVHDVSVSSSSGEFLGVSFDRDGRIRNQPNRFWKVVRSLNFLLSRRRCSGKDSENLLGTSPSCCCYAGICFRFLHHLLFHHQEL